MKKNYILVNVFGIHGYSFMIYGEYDINHESEVIDACLKNDLFEAEEDAETCSLAEPTDYDIKYFSDMIHEI